MSLFLSCKSLTYLGIRGAWAKDGGFEVITVESFSAEFIGKIFECLYMGHSLLWIWQCTVM